jgi:hypothetical protein
MSTLQKPVVTLRITSDSLDPSEITEMLGAPPSQAEIKGQEIIGQQTRVRRIAKTGAWRLYATDPETKNVDARIQEILGQLTFDLDVWQKIAEKFHVDLLCPVFVGDTNNGFALSPQSLAALGQRHIELQLDVYAATKGKGVLDV